MGCRSSKPGAVAVAEPVGAVEERPSGASEGPTLLQAGSTAKGACLRAGEAGAPAGEPESRFIGASSSETAQGTTRQEGAEQAFVVPAEGSAVALEAIAAAKGAEAFPGFVEAYQAGEVEPTEHATAAWSADATTATPTDAAEEASRLLTATLIGTAVSSQADIVTGLPEERIEAEAPQVTEASTPVQGTARLPGGIVSLLCKPCLSESARPITG